jgi:protoporphyrinogen oxidase
MSAEKQKINYDSVILTILLYSTMPLLKEIVNFMTWHEILFLTTIINVILLENQRSILRNWVKMQKLWFIEHHLIYVRYRKNSTKSFTD